MQTSAIGQTKIYNTQMTIDNHDDRVLSRAGDHKNGYGD